MQKPENESPRRRQTHYRSSPKMEAMVARLRYVGEHIFSGNLKAYAKVIGVSKSRLKRILSVHGRFNVSIFLKFVESGIAAAEWLLCGTGPIHGRADKIDDAAGYVPAEMKSRYPLFDTLAALPQLPVTPEQVLPFVVKDRGMVTTCMPIAKRLFRARTAGNPVVLFLDGAALSAGVAPIVLELMRRKCLTAVALTAPAAAIDYYSAKGQAYDNGALQNAVFAASRAGLGFGEGVATFGFGKNDVREHSILASGYDLGIPVTVHAALGADPAHAAPALYGPEHGAAIGATSYVDLLIFIAHLVAFNPKAPSLFLASGSEAAFAYQLFNTAISAGATTAGALDTKNFSVGWFGPHSPFQAFTFKLLGEYGQLFPAFLRACTHVYEGDCNDHKKCGASGKSSRSSGKSA